MAATKVLPLGAMTVALLALSMPAQAITIDINPPATMNNTEAVLDGPSSDRAQTSQLLITDPGGSTPDSPGATVDAATRFIANVAADRPVALSGGEAFAGLVVDYTVGFSVTPDHLSPLFTYNVTIATHILGAVTSLDDGLGLATSGTADIIDVAGYLAPSGFPNASLSLSSATTHHGTSNTSGFATQLSASNVLLLGPFSGVREFLVEFDWQMSASSPQSFQNGDEAAVRLGAQGGLSGTTADNYPGVGNRIQANDGHFVTITATMVSAQMPDVNMDGSVDIFDVNLVSDHWGDTGAPGIPGDANYDGIVDIFDINSISDHWSPTATPVPEPTSAVLTIGGLLVFVGAHAVRGYGWYRA